MNHIVVWNLMKKDLTEKRVEKIEKAIKTAIRIVIGSKFLDDLSFSFPHDPTVTSEKIPVAVDAIIIFDKDNDGVTRQILRKHIRVYVMKAISAWRKVYTVKSDIRFTPD